MSARRINDSDDRAAALWADERRRSGLTASRHSQFEAWVKDRPDRRRLLHAHERLIDDPALLWATQRVARSGESRRRVSWLGQRGMAGACLAGLAAAVVMVGMLAAPDGDRIVGTRGNPRPVILSDGSSVRLNGASEMRVDLGRHERRVVLEGEGFFEIAPDENRPFSVQADDVRVTAVGTRFNVDRVDGPAGSIVEVVVFEGAVDVAQARGIVTRLRAGERLRVAGGMIQKTTLAQPEAETALPAWTQGWLELEAAPLAAVIDDLERSTDVRVDLKGERLAELQVSGRFAYDRPENVLAAIAGLHGLKLVQKSAGRFEISEG